MTAFRRPLATVATAVGATLLLAAPAAAHPSFNPNTVPAGERHTLELVIPHGCVPHSGAPAEGEEASPTVALSVEVPESGVAFIAPHAVEGWTVSTSANAFTWSDDGGSTTDPITFTVDVELAADVADAVHFSVAQDCTEGSMLWAAAPGRDGENPAAVLLVGDAVGTTEVDHGDGDHGDGGTTDEHAADASGDGHADDAEHGDADMEHAAADGHGDSGPAPLDGGLVLLVLVLFVGGMAAILKMD